MLLISRVVRCEVANTREPTHVSQFNYKFDRVRVPLYSRAPRIETIDLNEHNVLFENKQVVDICCLAAGVKRHCGRE